MGNIALTATGNWRQLNLSWQAAPNAASYSYYYNIKGQTTIYTGSVATPSTTAIITNLTDNIYEVYVVAFDSGNKALAKSNVEEITLLADTSTPPTVQLPLSIQPLVYGAGIVWVVPTVVGQWASGVNFFELTITDNNGVSFTRETALNTYTLTDLNPLLLYSVSIKTVSKAGNYSIPTVPTPFACLPGTDTVPPGKISNFVGGPPLSAVPLGGAIQLSWSAALDPTGAGITSSGIASYTLEFGKGTTTLGTVNSAFSGMTVSSLTNGEAYWFRVRAKDGAGNLGAWSDKINATPLARDIAGPPTPEFTAVSGNGLVYVQIAAVEDRVFNGFQTSGVLHYVIRYYNALATQTITTQITTNTYASIPTRTVDGTAPMNMLLYVTVAACDANGNESAQSAAVLVSSQIPGTGVDTTAPSQILHVDTKPLNGGLAVYSRDIPIDITNVNEVCSGIDHYDYRYSSDGGVTWSYLNNKPYDDATITGLTNGTEYVVQVRAVDAAGNEAPWSIAAIGTPSLPPPPTNLNVTIDGRTAIVTWTPTNPGLYEQLTGYRITDSFIYNGVLMTIPTVINDKNASAATINIIPGYNYTFSIAATTNTISIPGGQFGPIYAPEVADITAPSAPNITSIVSKNQELEINWGASTNTVTAGELALNLDGYEVEYKAIAPPAGTFTSVGLVSDPITTKSIIALVNGVTYGVRVRAVDLAGNKSAWSSIVTGVPRAIDTTFPVPLTDITVTPAHKTLNISWTASQDPINPAQQTGSVFGYKVFCSSVNGIEPTKILSGTASSCVFDNLTNGVTYTIYLQVTDTNGNFNESQNITGIPVFVADSTSPNVPTLTPSATPGQVTLNWSAVTDREIVGQYVSGMKEYIILESTDDGVTYVEAATSIPISSNSKVFAGRVNGTTYTYKVGARDNAGNIAWSDKANATPLGLDTTAPQKSMILTRVGKDQAVDLTWQEVTDTSSTTQLVSNLKGYTIYYRQTLVPGVIYNTFLLTGTSTTISNLINGVEYEFAIETEDNAGNKSDLSTYQKGTPLGPDETAPTVPTGLKLIAGNGIITVSWNESTDPTNPAEVTPSGIKWYNIEYKLSSSLNNYLPWVGNFTTRTQIITGLMDGTSYDVRVRAVDNAGNNSAWSTALSATTTGSQQTAICFLASAPVLTPCGFRPISLLRIGDRVRTADGRTVTIKRTLRKEYTPSVAVNPYIIPAGLYGAKKDLAISPNHEVQTPAGMVAAKHLGLKQMTMSGPFTYYNIEVDDWVTDNLVVAGVEVESLAPHERIRMPISEFAAMMKERYGNNKEHLHRAMSLCTRNQQSVLTPAYRKT
jgi:chitodextrinase